jgi:hypothetical protein
MFSTLAGSPAVRLDSRHIRPPSVSRKLGVSLRSSRARNTLLRFCLVTVSWNWKVKFEGRRRRFRFL